MMDLADIIKDAIVIPTAFQASAEKIKSSAEVKSRLLDRIHNFPLHKDGALGFCYDVMKKVIADIPESLMPAMVEDGQII